MRTIFKLIPDIMRTNVLTKFHEDWKKYMTKEKCPPPAIIRTNVLTKFHKDWTINVNSIELTRKNALQPGGHAFQRTGTILKLSPEIMRENVLTKKNATPPTNFRTNVMTKFHKDLSIKPPGGHVFQRTGPNLELSPDIIGKNVLTKFHEDWTKNLTSWVLKKKNAQPPSGHKQMLILTKFHEDLTINMTSRVLTRKKAPSPGGHVFQPTRTSLQLS
ncbi:hypothetical protein DPMN_155219 [Dreissena polymorpha]|uniref:Uncharacterized protein n=1 Tax=Dreissena polymorpha TaxID=45954 RepID=A0A9D4FLW0_DREPO|nr:hypothetical protein DPMN_155219 [Dreissena polymorpha]